MLTTAEAGPGWSLELHQDFPQEQNGLKDLNLPGWTSAESLIGNGGIGNPGTWAPK